MLGRPKPQSRRINEAPFASQGGGRTHEHRVACQTPPARCVCRPSACALLAVRVHQERVRGKVLAEVPIKAPRPLWPARACTAVLRQLACETQELQHEATLPGLCDPGTKRARRPGPSTDTSTSPKLAGLLRIPACAPLARSPLRQSSSNRGGHGSGGRSPQTTAQHTPAAAAAATQPRIAELGGAGAAVAWSLPSSSCLDIHGG